MTLERTAPALRFNLVYAQLQAANQQIRDLQARVAELLQSRPKLISPSEYARLYHKSVSTVNRACNGELGYKFDGFTEARAVGQRQNGQPVVRWYIAPDARIVHVKSGKGG